MHIIQDPSLTSMREQEMNSYAANLESILPGAAVHIRGSRIKSLYNIPRSCLYKTSHLSGLRCTSRLSGQECVHVHSPLFKCMSDCHLPLRANRLPAPLMRGVWLSSMWPRTEAPLCSAAVGRQQTDFWLKKLGKWNTKRGCQDHL